MIDTIQFIIIDLFCGAGGTTTGFEMAFTNLRGVKVAKVIACVNHDHLAIESHWKNHPEIEHFEEDIRILDPYTRLLRLLNIYRAFYPDAKVILWASLECTNFSKAKGGMPRDADSRTLAEHLYKYVDALQPDYIQIENVVEFMSWGPLDENGKPISKKSGSDWLKWRNELCSRGYYDDWKELNAADFGAYTSRNRLFGCFAKHGLPISWPAPTHNKRPEKVSIPIKKWKPVKEVLDFDDEGNTIFNRKKALSTKTMQRLFMGCVKHIAGGKDQFLTKFFSGKPQHKNASVDDPSPSITTFGGGGLVTAERFIMKNYSGKPEDKNSSVDSPLATITTVDHNAIVKAEFITKFNSNNAKTGGHPGHSIDEPSPVVTTQGRLGLVHLDYLTQYHGHGENYSVEQPATTLSTKDRLAKVKVEFIDMQFSQGKQNQSVDEPLGAITTVPKSKLIQADFFIDKQFSGDDNHQSIDQPAGSILPNDKHNLVSAEKFILNGNYGHTDNSIEQPAPVLTASRRHHYIVNPSWGGHSGSVDEPCHVVIARQDKAPLYVITCKEGPLAVPVYEDDCEWTIKLKEFMALYNICDIKMRMLKVPELKKIQGFPESYILLGNQTDQKKFIGNAVHPKVPLRWILAMGARVFPNQYLNAA